MLIPLGILAAAGSSVAPAMELIETALGTGSSSTIQFNSIPQNYKHLQLRWVARASTSGDATMLARLNGVTTSSYAWHRLKGAGTTVSSQNGINQTSVLIENGVAPTGVANLFDPCILDILDYTSTTKNTTLRSLSGSTGGFQVTMTSGLFMSTEAVSSITLTTGNSNINAASRFSLYGIKG